MGGRNGSNGKGAPPGGPPDPALLSMLHRVPTIDFGKYEIQADIISVVPREECERLCVLPVSRAGSSLVVAMVDPVDRGVIEALAALTGYRIEPVIASERDIRTAIAKYHR